MTQPDETVNDHEAFEADFSDYYEEALPTARTSEVKEHLATCSDCRTAYDEFKDALTALSGLRGMSAPVDFDTDVAETIRQRSGGRFFGRKAFGDRVPFELLAIVALVIMLIAFLLVRSSDTGSLRYDSEPTEPKLAPGAKEALPSP